MIGIQFLSIAFSANMSNRDSGEYMTNSFSVVPDTWTIVVRKIFAEKQWL